MIARANAIRKAAFGVLIITGATIGVAHAISDTAFIYSSPKTGFYTLDSADMVPEATDAQYINDNKGGIHPQGTAITCFFSGVHLPNGATITQTAVWYKSGSGPLQPVFDLYRKRLSDNMSDEIAFRGVNDNSNVRTSISVPINASVATINTGLYSYAFRICLGGTDDTMYAARISYSYRSAGD